MSSESNLQQGLHKEDSTPTTQKEGLDLYMTELLRDRRKGHFLRRVDDGIDGILGDAWELETSGVTNDLVTRAALGGYRGVPDMV